MESGSQLSSKNKKILNSEKKNKLKVTFSEKNIQRIIQTKEKNLKIERSQFIGPTLTDQEKKIMSENETISKMMPNASVSLLRLFAFSFQFSSKHFILNAF